MDRPRPLSENEREIMAQIGHRLANHPSEDVALFLSGRECAVMWRLGEWIEWMGEQDPAFAERFIAEAEALGIV